MIAAIAAGCRFRVGVWGFWGDDDGGGGLVVGVELRRLTPEVRRHRGIVDLRPHVSEARRGAPG